jgi:hypothetical protein
MPCDALWPVDKPLNDAIDECSHVVTLDRHDRATLAGVCVPTPSRHRATGRPVGRVVYCPCMGGLLCVQLISIRL